MVFRSIEFIVKKTNEYCTVDYRVDCTKSVSASSSKSIRFRVRVRCTLFATAESGILRSSDATKFPNVWNESTSPSILFNARCIPSIARTFKLSLDSVFFLFLATGVVLHDEPASCSVSSTCEEMHKGDIIYFFYFLLTDAFN